MGPAGQLWLWGVGRCGYLFGIFGIFGDFGISGVFGVVCWEVFRREIGFILFSGIYPLFFSAGNWIYPSGKRTNPGPEGWEGFGRPWRRTRSREELPAGSFGVLWARKPQNFTGGIFSSPAPRNDRGNEEFAETNERAGNEEFNRKTTLSPSRQQIPSENPKSFHKTPKPPHILCFALPKTPRAPQIPTAPSLKPQVPPARIFSLTGA